MNLIGKSPIAIPALIAGKLSFISCWLFIFTKNFGIEAMYDTAFTRVCAGLFILTGIVIMMLGIVHLGRSIAVGLPDEKTQLKTKGIYSITRNPIYVGMLITCIGSCLLILHPINIALFLTALIIHHVIILREERFLESAFGDEWKKYKIKVPRYIFY